MQVSFRVICQNLELRNNHFNICKEAVGHHWLNIHPQQINSLEKSLQFKKH